MCIFRFSKKHHLVCFLSLLNYGDIGSVLIKHLQIVIPLSYPCYYTNLCPHKPHKPTHTHTHAHTHIIKGIVLPEMNILTSFTHPHVIPNLHGNRKIILLYWMVSSMQLQWTGTEAFKHKMDKKSTWKYHKSSPYNLCTIFSILLKLYDIFSYSYLWMKCSFYFIFVVWKLVWHGILPYHLC